LEEHRKRERKRKRGIKIAIDGPAASGKTSTGLALASYFGCRFLNTGAMYRAAAWGLLNGYSLEEMDIEITPSGRVMLGGRDITTEVYTQKIDDYSSEVAADPKVRAKLIELQRKISQEDIVMEGRDIGTVVLKGADVKIFLKGSLEERARRRHKERGGCFEEIKAKMRERDIKDSQGFGRLKLANDTIIIETDNKSLEEVIAEAIQVAEDILRKAGKL
jgi:cytidylate kinase